MFLSSSQLHKLPSDAAVTLEAPICLDKLKKVVQSMNEDRSPVLHGLPRQRASDRREWGYLWTVP